jgi:hypothetical protein
VDGLNSVAKMAGTGTTTPIVSTWRIRQKARLQPHLERLHLLFCGVKIGRCLGDVPRGWSFAGDGAMSEHQWYYHKSGLIDDENHGALTEKTFLQEVRDGKIGLQTPVLSLTRTSNKWHYLQQIPQFAQIIEEGKAERARLAEEKKLQRALEAQQKQEQKRKEKDLRAEEKKRRQAEQTAERERQLAALQEQRRLQDSQPHPIQGTLIAPSQAQAIQYPATRTDVVVVQSAGGSPFAAASVVQQQPVVVVVQQQAGSNKTAAILLNAFLLPGLGQLIQGRAGIGVALIISWFVSIALLFSALAGFLCRSSG